MRRLVITEQSLGQHTTMVAVETSDGKRATSTTVEGALVKLLPASLQDVPPEHLLGTVFLHIRDDGSANSQIHSGVQS